MYFRPWSMICHYLTGDFVLVASYCSRAAVWTQDTRNSKFGRLTDETTKWSDCLIWLVDLWVIIKKWKSIWSFAHVEIMWTVSYCKNNKIIWLYQTWLTHFWINSGGAQRFVCRFFLFKCAFRLLISWAEKLWSFGSESLSCVVLCFINYYKDWFKGRTQS